MLLVRCFLCVLLPLFFSHEILAAASNLDEESEMKRTSESKERSKRAFDVNLLLRDIFLKSASFSELKSNLKKTTTTTTTTRKPRTTKKPVQFIHPLFYLSSFKKGYIPFNPTEEPKPSPRPTPMPMTTKKPKKPKQFPPQGHHPPHQFYYQHKIPAQYYEPHTPPAVHGYGPAPFGNYYTPQSSHYVYHQQQPRKGVSFAYTQPSDASYDDAYAYNGNYRQPNYDYYDFARANPNAYNNDDYGNSNDNGDGGNNVGGFEGGDGGENDGNDNDNDDGGAEANDDTNGNGSE